MVKNAVGLLEVVGLAAAVEAADAAVKAANIVLLGYELTKGGGMVVVKLSGDVGAVKAAVEAAAAAAARVNRVVATHVIPRPHQEVGALIVTKETVGAVKENLVLSVADETVVPLDLPVAADVDLPDLSAPLAEDKEPVEHDQPESAVESKKWSYTCNLCGDPACRRRKGESRQTCLHYDKNNKEDE